jgi:hypothetical protein
MITTPGHGAYPSGHGMQAFMLARLVDGLLDLSSPSSLTTATTSTAAPSKALQLYRQAARIATNRVVAGVHFPVDGIAGRMLGHVVAEYILARLGIESKVLDRKFDPAGLNGKTLELDITKQTIDVQPTVSMGYTIGTGKSVAKATGPSSVLAKLYEMGADERKALRP